MEKNGGLFIFKTTRGDIKAVNTHWCQLAKLQYYRSWLFLVIIHRGP